MLRLKGNVATSSCSFSLSLPLLLILLFISTGIKDFFVVGTGTHQLSFLRDNFGGSSSSSSSSSRLHSSSSRRCHGTTRSLASILNRSSFKTKNSDKIFKEARKIMPGGVSSPVRAFKSVGGQPIVFDRVKGAYVWDVDGNK